LSTFAQRAAVAAADDANASRFRVRKQHRMREHFVVEKVLAVAQHREAVDDHQVTEVLRFRRRQWFGSAFALRATCAVTRKEKALPAVSTTSVNHSFSSTMVGIRSRDKQARSVVPSPPRVKACRRR
jgi:hypothetical protein